MILIAFEYVRDEISHSWDIQSEKVTRTASEVLKYKEGMCYAKSMLLCALLRSQGIPPGFCYQKLTLGDTPETGYCIHALNVVFISTINNWIRIDARGNTNGKIQICENVSVFREFAYKHKFYLYTARATEYIILI